MVILVLAVGLACLVVALMPGLTLAFPGWRGTPILFLALAAQVVFVAFPPAWMSPRAATFMYLATQGGVVVFLILNRSVKWIWVVAVGLMLNASVIAVNGAMPVSPAAVEAAGAESLHDERHVEHGVHLRNEPMTENTRLAGLADVIPVPPLHKVVSVGDVILMLGLISVILGCVTRTTAARKVDAAPDPGANPAAASASSGTG